LCLLFVTLLLLLANAGVAQAQVDDQNPNLVPPAPLNEKILRLPGDPDRPVTLEVTLYTPAGRGPFPLAVLNHGATNVGNGNRGTRYRYTFNAFYFLSRGYAVALPMARGFAGSGGDLVHDGCNLEAVGQENAQDIRAVIDALRRQPDIDGGRIVIAGQSFGGWTTMALGSMEIPGVRGWIGFSPALRTSDCQWQDQAMISNARRFGATARYSSLWFYGDNDSVLPVATWHTLFSAYSAGAKKAELVPVGAFMTDSHQLLSFPEGLPIWTPRVDAFLARVGLPSAQKYPAYLPTPTPPASHFAAIDDVSAVPGLNDRGRDAYRKFLAMRFPRVFALAPGGAVSATDGGFDPLARALAACAKSNVACAPYAIDGQVVWTGGQEAPKDFARTVATGQTTTLNFAYAVNPDCSTRESPKLWVSGKPAHGIAEVVARDGHPSFPQGNPFAVCNAASVPGVAVTYTPAPGFTGSDTVVFEELTRDGRHRAFRIGLTVQ
jgi:dienelactone hydrolase